ncbi:hypothetical protein Pf1_02386 [Flavobacterium columnare]|uniref:hypothetical protein n=1 Tax=Flavobacterium columnare TaxID=996 RepID=UPI0007F98A97|nr:hypothetical protein [Flavobacterium columnare]ANO47840.1 hypothetical protein Pf1_02386 [Flavobacterium columnare]APT21564.1 hypothetical protein BU993_02275 [Flavobacterium columnare]
MEILNSLYKEIASGLSITKNEFSHLSYDKDYNIGLFFRENKNKIDIITYGFGYDYRKYNPITLCKESFRAGIHFKEVDRILYRILGGKTISKDTLFYSSHEVTIKEILAPDITTDTQHTIVFADSIIKEKELERVVAETDSFINRYYIPFFSEFLSLQDINDKILEKEKWQDWSNYIFGKTYFKAMIILKLTGNEKGYQEFTTMYISRIEEGIKNGRDDLQPYLDDVIRLHQYLESGAYKNLLNE